MADVGYVKIGLYNFMVVGLMSLLFVTFAKLILAKHYVNGLSEVVSA